MNSHAISVPKVAILILLGLVTGSLAKPFLLLESDEEPNGYKDTEEILNDWNNDESYEDYSAENQGSPVMSYLPPVFIDLKVPPSPVPTTTTSTTKRPSYFPNTNVHFGPSLSQLNRARNNHPENPVELPVPLIVWAHEGVGKHDKVSYWSQLKNSVYKVD